MPHVVSAAPINLYDLTRPELTALFAHWEFSPVHVARLWNYLYWECVDSPAAMPELPAKVRTRLTAETRLGVLPTAMETDSSDGFTRKYLLKLDDDAKIETVIMRFTGRVTACISSQVGCAMGCVFCATGQMGYTRHLTPGEIVAQAVHVQRALRQPAQALCHVLRDKVSAAKAMGDGARLRNVGLTGERRGARGERGIPEGPGNVDGLGDDFARGQVAGVAHLAGGAEDAAHRAADLRTHARRHPAGEAHEHGFDFFCIGEREEIFMGEAVARGGLERRGQHAEVRLGGETGAEFRRQLGHGVERGGELDVEIVPEPCDVHRIQLPTHKLPAKLLAGEIVEVEARGGHDAGE